MAIATITAGKKSWTYEDYARLDDDKRYEVIAGELLMAPAPGSFHQDVSANLHFLLLDHVRKLRLGKVLAAPLDVILDKQNVVQPDLVFIARANQSIIQSHGITGKPEAVIEIISNASVQRDRIRKKALYERFEIPEYWLVDPASRTIEILTLAEGRYQPFAFATEKGKIKSQVISGLELDLTEIFS